MLPVAPVVVLVWLELLAMLPVDPVCALADVVGVLDCELMSLEELLGDAALAVSGLFGVDGVELLGEVLLGELVVLELELELPEMLPAVF